MILCGVASAMLAATSVAAEDKDPCGPGMVCASAPATVGAALIKAGYQGLVEKAKDGDPKVESAAAGYGFTVHFYGCEKNVACDALQFISSFKKDAAHTAALANKWNSTKRFIQMSVSDDGSLDLRYDVSTMGGLPAKNFADVIDWWTTMLGSAGRFFDENLPADTKKPS